MTDGSLGSAPGSAEEKDNFRLFLYLLGLVIVIAFCFCAIFVEANAL